MNIFVLLQMDEEAKPNKSIDHRNFYNLSIAHMLNLWPKEWCYLRMWRYQAWLLNTIAKDHFEWHSPTGTWNWQGWDTGENDTFNLDKVIVFVKGSSALRSDLNGKSYMQSREIMIALRVPCMNADTSRLEAGRHCLGQARQSWKKNNRHFLQL